MTPQDIIDYWYSDRIRKHWFASTPELDNEIQARFESVWERAAAGELDDWCDDALGCLALVIILDQFPLNMFRGQAKSFQTERKAIEVAKLAVVNKFDHLIDKDKLAFLFMPLMHSENLTDQDMSVQLYEAYGLEHNLKFAKHHRELVRRFGRFPHRNTILGRDSTAEEHEYLASEQAFKG